MNTTKPSKFAKKLGHLSFSLYGEGETFDYLKKELSCLPDFMSSEVDLDIQIKKKIPRAPRGAIATKTYIGWENGYQYIRDGFRYQLTKSKGRYQVIFEDIPKDDAIAPDALRRFFDWNYLSRAQNHAKNFMYNCFNLITGAAITDRGIGCYLHASSMERRGFGVVLAASGGVGKTTSLLNLVMERGWSYLSDDIALIDRYSTLHRTPLRIQVYAYNIVGHNKATQNLLGGRTLLDRLSWHVRLIRKGPFKTRRRVSSEDFFGEEATSTQAQCRSIIFMERALVDEPSINPVDADIIVNKLCRIMPKEIGGLDDLSDNLYLTNCGLMEFCQPNFITSYKDLLKMSLAGASSYIFSIPYDYPAHNLAGYVADFLDDISR
jgi:hypothetical protein